MAKILYSMSRQILEQVQLDPLLSLHLRNIKNQNHTYPHSYKVALLSIDLGQDYLFYDHDLVNLGYAGLLHEDQRNSKVPAGILSKIFPLMNKESGGINLKRKDFLQLSDLSQEVREIIQSHQSYKQNPIQERKVQKTPEIKVRYNNPEILFSSQILALCELYESLKAGRNCKQVKNKEKRIHLVRQNFLGYPSLVDRLVQR